MAKSLGKTVLGWFVVDEDEGPEAAQPAREQTAEELVAKYAAGPPAAAAPDAAPPARASSAPAASFAPGAAAGFSATQGGSPATAWSASASPVQVQFSGDLPRSAGAVVDFKGVYVAAGISAEEQERVEKAIALVSTLPKETPLDIKKQIVEASLKAFGIPVDAIIEAGAQQIQSLEGYIQHGEVDTQNVLAESASRIAELSAEIETIRGLMSQQIAEQQGLASSCNGEKLRVQSVLEFFGQEAIARVVKDSSKLVDLG